MTISGISGGGFTNPFAKVREDFRGISDALSSGNLESAQKSFATLQSDTSSQASGTNNPMNRDIESLGNALSSGNLEDAQKAFDKIQQHLKGHGEFAKQQIDLQSLLASDSTDSSSGSSSSGSSSSIRDELKNLSTALQSGNLADAKSALTTLLNDVGSQDGGDDNDPFKKDLQSLGSALDSGNISDAQQMFSQIQQKMSQRPQGPPPPPPDSGSTSQVSATDATTSDTLTKELQALSDALGSGNLSDAQSAFKTLMEDLSSQSDANSQGNSSSQSQSAKHHHHWQLNTSTTDSADNSGTSSTTGVSDYA